MSELTKCNYCTLQWVKKRNPGKEVKVVKAGKYKYCDLQVYVDGQPLGIWFAELSDHCVC